MMLPQVLQGDRIELEGETLQIAGLQSPVPERSYVWIPSIKTVAGGVVVFNDLHVWTADTQTLASRQQWLATLDGIAALQPQTVMPGHFKTGSALSPASIGFTRDYLVRFEAEAAAAANSTALITRMQELYPQAGLKAALDTSAKVAKGEMQW